MNDVIKFLMKYSSKDNIIDSIQLARHFDISRVEVRQLINKARCEGIPICSSGFGYYYSTDDREIAKTVKSLSGRVHSINSAIAGMNAYMESNYDNLF